MRIQFIAAAAAATVSTISAANAGGYVAPTIEVEPLVAAAPSWQGAYVGATLGYAFGGDDRVGWHEIETGERGNIGKLELSGFNAGLRVGYLWQRDNWVFGPELGYESGSVDDSFWVTFEDGDLSPKSKIKNVLALRLKAGHVVRPDTLVYGILGVARADIEYRLEATDGDVTGTIARDFNKTGYVAGLGMEKRLNERWSLTGEYEYANFGKTTRDFIGFITKATPDYHNIKLGVNYRF